MQQRKYKITVVLIILFLSLILGLSLAAILQPAASDTECIADIYQDGNLLTSIPLDGSHASSRFTVTGENGCMNEIEVRSDSIGVVSADCPDQLCVHQGFIGRAGLPVVCLPNKLVIRLRENDPDDVDMIAY